MRELTSVQIEFLRILETFMHDKEYRFPDDFVQLGDLCQMSRVHNMIPAVYEQIRKEEILRQADFQEISQILKRQTIREVMMQTQRAEGFKQVYQKFCEAGIRPLVVKGMICRNLYTKSDYRVSGDEDMLVKREEFEVCDGILLAAGFRREELDRNELPYEIPYIQPQTGVYIELHFSLFPEESGAYGHLNQEFQQVFEHSISEDVQGTKIWTLSPTDHMFYLICHSFKHFLHSGFGVRQVCDMVKMEAYYKEQIDWKSINEKLERLHMGSYWRALVEIGNKYLGATWNLESEGVDCQELLFDLLDSGIYGDSSMERKHSSNMTLAAAKSGKKNTAASLTESLFPKIDYMKEKYTWLVEHPWLLPVAWGARMFNYLRLMKKRDNQENSVEIGMNRVELLRKYNIIE